MRRFITCVSALALLLMVVFRGATASAETITDQSFRVEWSDATDANGRPRLTGYVYNDAAEPAMDVYLRIAEVDSAGREVASRITPLDETVPAKGRVYFDVPVSGGGSHRVSVTSFEFVEGTKS
jgi:hypothetical protein